MKSFVSLMFVGMIYFKVPQQSVSSNDCDLYITLFLKNFLEVSNFTYKLHLMIESLIMSHDLTYYIVYTSSTVISFIGVVW